VSGKGIAAAAFLSSAAHAEKGRWIITSSVDYLAPGNASKQVRKAAEESCRSAITAGSATCAYSSTTQGAFGGRVGVMWAAEGHSFGPSIGYLYGGPNLSGKYSLTTTPAGTYELKQTNHTFRFLAEGQQDFELSESWAAFIGTGLGVAVDANKISCTASGALATECAGAERKKNFGWATWEVSPGIAYKGLTFALRYAGFARKHEVPWNTFGASLGGRF